MNKLLLLIVALLFLGCGSQKNISTNTIEQMPKTDMKSALEYLASDALQGRQTGTIGIEKAATFIEHVFKENNVPPYFETYRDSFYIDNIVGYNIVGYVEGNDERLKDEFIILGGHYDHIGTAKSVYGDTIANGANDNASGTVAILEMANYIAAKKNNKRSIIFVLFSAEEMGLLGSKHLAKKLFEQEINLYAMVNFEMIGVPFKNRDYDAFLTGYEMSNMASKINEYLGTKLIGFSEVSKKYNLFRQSDNATFYDLFKVPCQTISSCDLSNYNYYHHVDDEMDKLDYSHMVSLINKVLPAIEKMSQTPNKEIELNNE
ncbi:M20/M25/M40 family metallo-hydrolase [Flavisericum labens]|uniref:M20/M25/M40 family metallo-hydrolase n=1 Tax=Flavisericum labens TaxID=3377112 RepID=UPI00387B76A1